MRTRKLALAILLALVGLGVVSGYALRVAPVIFDVEVPRGTDQTLSFTVRNDESDPVSIEIALCDWRRDVHGNNRFCDDAEGVDRSATSWLSVTPEQFDLESEATRDVRIDMAVPDAASNGEPLSGTYWSAAMIAASPQAGDDDEGGTQIVVKRRFGLKVLASIRGTGTRQGQVSNLRRHGLNPLWLTLEFQNRGSLNLPNVSGRVEIRNDQGETIERIEIQEFPILPGAIRQLRVTSTRSPGERLAPGRYVALAVLDFGGDNAVGAQAVFDVPELNLEPLGDADAVPQDLDDDGVYEDVNGDGEFTLDDPTLLGFAVDGSSVQANWPAFDVNNDGQADFDDVIALKDQLNSDE